MATDVVKAGFFSLSNVKCLVPGVVKKPEGPHLCGDECAKDRINFAEVVFLTLQTLI